MKRLARPWLSWTTLGMLTLASSAGAPMATRAENGATSQEDGPKLVPTPVATESTSTPADLPAVPSSTAPSDPQATTPPTAPATVPAINAPSLSPVEGPTRLKPVPAAPVMTVIQPRAKAVGSDTQGVEVPAPVEIHEEGTKSPPKALKGPKTAARPEYRPALPPLNPSQIVPAPRFAASEGAVELDAGAGPSGTPRLVTGSDSAPTTVAVPNPKSVPAIPVTSTIPLNSEPKLAPTPVPTLKVSEPVVTPAPVITSAPTLAAPAPTPSEPTPVTEPKSEPAVPSLTVPTPAAPSLSVPASEPATAPVEKPAVSTPPVQVTPPAAVTAPEKATPEQPAAKSPELSKDSSGAGSEVREPKNVPALPATPAPSPGSANGSTPGEAPKADAAKVKEAEPEKPRDPLLTLVDQAIELTAQRQLRVGMNSPWQIVHGVVALRWDMKIYSEDGSRQINAIEYLMGGNYYENQPLWQETAWGGRGHPYTRPYAHEGHPTQFLGYMTMANIPLDYEIKTPTKIITVRDVINDAKMQVRQGPEITWTLWALAHYEEPDAQWRNNANEPWSIERLVRLQVDERVTNSACGGCHGMFALCYARNLYFLTGKPLSGVWMEADQKIKWYTEATRRMQNTDGSFSSNFYKGPGHSTDFDTRLNTTGHQLEWILVSLPQSRLNEPWVRRAVESLSRDLITNARFPSECGPMYHSLHSLILYRQRLDPKYRVPKRNSPLKLAERDLTKTPLVHTLPRGTGVVQPGAPIPGARFPAATNPSPGLQRR